MEHQCTSPRWLDWCLRALNLEVAMDQLTQSGSARSKERALGPVWLRRGIVAATFALFMVASQFVRAQAPITFQYFYDGLGQLTRVVDSTGVVIEYVYDPVGNILEVKR